MSIVPADDTIIEQAAALLRQGRLVALPTETVYGLGADAKNPEAVKRIFAAKGRPADHPLIVHIANVNQLTDWAVDIPDAVYKLAECYWPGPLTIVLRKHPDVPLAVTGGQNSVALRIPNHPVALKLLKAFGGGIAAPSANRFCRISPTQASHVEEELGENVDLILDGGACHVGLESTIIDLSGAKPRLLRPGQINREEIEALLLSELDLGQNLDIRIPGMMPVHYSPRTYTMLCTDEQIKDIQLELLVRNASSKKVGVLSFSGQVQSDSQTYIVDMPNNVTEYSHLLYKALREMDNSGLDILLIEQPPETNLWQAVNDRLSKAARPFSILGDFFYENIKFDPTRNTFAFWDWINNLMSNRLR